MNFGLRDVVFVGLLIAVPVASWYYVFKPRNAQIRQARQENDAKRADLGKLSRQTGQIKDISRLLEQSEETLRGLTARIPSVDEVDDLLQKITQAAKEHNLKVPLIKGEKPVPAAQYMELPMKTVIEGQFEGFYQFLLDVEQMPRITRVHQMKLTRLVGKPSDEEMPPPGSMKAEFTLSIYYQNASQANVQATGKEH